MPQLDQALQPFELKSPSGDVVGLTSLVESGLLVLAMIEADNAPDPRLDMLRELGRSAPEFGANLVVVSPGECGVGRQLEAAGFARWLNDGGEAFSRLDLAERKLGRTRRSGGIFVLDSDTVLRFAFSSKDAEQWIPASFVTSRLRRLRAAMGPVEVAPAPEVQAEAEAEAAPEPELEHRSQSAVDGEMDDLVRRVGERLGLSAEDLSRLSTASRFRDLGMAMVPNSIITKDGPLTDEEWNVIKQHPERSAEMLGQGAALEPVREIVRASHEHLDGSGYPRGLVADQIPLGARILLACESYLAMTQERPYREMLGMRDAVDELRQYAGRIYDADVVDALVDVISKPGETSATVAA
jgi:HD domain